MKTNIKELREKAKISQTQLSKIIDVSTATLANYENDATEAGYEKLIILAEYFNVSLDYLLKRKQADLTQDKIDIIEKVPKLNDVQAIRMKAYIDGLLALSEEKQKDAPRNGWTNI